MYNDGMNRSFPYAIIFFTFFLAACSSPKEIAFESTSMRMEENLVDTLPTETATVTPISQMIEPKNIVATSPLCELEEPESQFLLSCADNQITIAESENRRGMDILLKREIAAATNGFSLEAEITSQPADPSRLDQNQAGFHFNTSNNRQFAVRLQGQYFNFEEWVVENGKEKIIALNQSYAPTMLSAGRPNNMRLVCLPDNCDLFANGTLAGRFPLSDIDGIASIGLFAASPWDERFGTVRMGNFSIEEVTASRPETQTFTLIDDLKADHGTFAQMGLSGAFSDFETDGFHFSPVIPYGYYSAKAGPALRNVSVSATVEMDFTPGVPTTQYGGGVCRASNEGMIIAVLRTNATYTIYRDSDRRKFAVLATDTVENISEGRSAHRLQLDCIDETISLFIDGNQAEFLTDTRYNIQYGRSGLFTKAGGAAYSDAIIFSDFEIMEVR